MTPFCRIAAFAALVTLLHSGRTAAQVSDPFEDCDLPQLWDWVFDNPGTGQGGNGEGGSSDLQVTIEVRFITLNDNFFEQIGVDFDFDIDDASTFPVGPTINNTGMNPDFNTPRNPNRPVPENPFLAPSIPFLSEPSATAFGTAILSDIEAFFFIEAAQGDRRNSIVDAPKVTLFNGQAANIARPRTGLAGFVPVIRLLPAGETLSVQAVVTADRRYVRLNMMPILSPVGNVRTFRLFGGNRFRRRQNQVPELTNTTDIQFAKKLATAILEDGQTVLLGPVKRLSEGRNERGVPILSRIPYVNRLLRNVGIDRESQPLMMMVTPRIIIQEEEE